MQSRRVVGCVCVCYVAAQQQLRGDLNRACVHTNVNIIEFAFLIVSHDHRTAPPVRVWVSRVSVLLCALALLTF